MAGATQDGFGLLVYPDMRRSVSFSFGHRDRGLLRSRLSVNPGPGSYDPKKMGTLSRSSKWVFGRSFRPLSDPFLAVDTRAYKTDRGWISPGPVYSRYTTMFGPSRWDL